MSDVEGKKPDLNAQEELAIPHAQDTASNDTDNTYPSTAMFEPLAQDIGFLDNLGLHFLCLDSNKQPTFISSSAARFFELDNPELVASGAMLITPLIELACQHQSDAANAVLSLADLTSAPKMHNLNLHTAKGQGRHIVAFVESLGAEGDELSAKSDFHSIVFFYDLSPLSTVSMILKQARVCRELYLGLVVKQLEMAEELSTITGKNRTPHSSNFRFAGIPMEEEEATDVLAGIHKAVQILDHCVLKSVSLNIKANTSGIAAIKEADFLRIVISLVNQACEFVGVSGKMLLETEVSTTAHLTDNPNLNKPCVKLLLRSERYSPIADPADPLASYVFYHCLPHYFGRFYTPKPDVSDDILSLHMQPPAYLRSNDRLEHNVAEHTAEVLAHFYENLQKTRSILTAHSGSLLINSVDKNTLDFIVELPLAQMRR